mmetsp:Transcript_62050/g.183319  ORF Transcript_62050/g.183319 Transcript_62050/m.183319 type:complete len:204 (-) Transcript_62050:2015-2626(-)
MLPHHLRPPLAPPPAPPRRPATPQLSPLGTTATTATMAMVTRTSTPPYLRPPPSRETRGTTWPSSSHRPWWEPPWREYCRCCSSRGRKRGGVIPTVPIPRAGIIGRGGGRRDRPPCIPIWRRANRTARPAGMEMRPRSREGRRVVGIPRRPEGVPRGSPTEARARARASPAAPTATATAHPTAAAAAATLHTPPSPSSRTIPA